ncbi:Protein SUPPRESSOR OF QUENCHING 1 [Cardamine amara subsp. amara]|uniref:Protein SUPPRESSOR OF QUENCHING 1 n=1 Tax=Cardamine amara subsp. amara TaxID=228776 RepID=A0ABD1A5W1_CARAN
MIHFKQSSTSASVGKISCKVYYCKEDEVCLYQSVQFEVPFKVESESSASPAITFTVKPRSSDTGGLQLQAT